MSSAAQPVIPSITLAEWQRLRYSLQWAYEAPVHPDYRHSTFSRHPMSAWFLRRGSVDFYSAGGRQRFESGMWIFPATDGERCFSADAVLLSIKFDLRWRDGCELFERTRTVTIPGSDDPELERAASSVVRFYQERFSAPFATLAARPASLDDYIKLESTLIDWIRVYSNALLRRNVPMVRMERRDPRVRTALNLINDTSLATRLAEGDIATRCGLSVAQMNRLFREQIGTSPVQVRKELRLREARLALATDRKPIKEIAFDLGFSSVAQLSAWFRRNTNLSPREFRKRYRFAPESVF